MASQARVALVTGGGSGIGKAVALALSGQGYAVVICGRRRGALQSTVIEATQAGCDVLAVMADVTDPAAVTRLFAQIRDRFGRLDLLFNNAGTMPSPLPIDELSIEQWRLVIDTNLTGAFLCTREAVRLMKVQVPRGGRIINNGSLSAQSPRPNNAPYTVAKHGMTGLTKSTSLEGRQYDIACGQIDIGNAATQLTEGIVRGVAQADGRIASEPRIDLSDVTRAVVYMSSLPLDANVQFMTVMATKMPFVGRG
jgi:NAD(P)-dependent dehydrogenase (short-subunit alcohol dehydrogenase family)